MYGMVNAAVRGLVVDNYGLDKWQRISKLAASPESFVAMQSYPDEITYRLIGAAESVLDTEATEILLAFGRYWVLHIASKSYAELMEASGSGFVDFVKNLDHMHQRIRVTFPDYRPPSFRVLVKDDQHLLVDYYSDRDGLLPFVEGLFHGLAAYYSIEIEIEHVPDDSHPLPCKRMIVTHT